MIPLSPSRRFILCLFASCCFLAAISTAAAVASTCAGSSGVCHAQARCQDYALGVCCACAEPSYYGNGVHCLERDLPMRVNGKVRGVLDGVRLRSVDSAAEIDDGLDLHSYVVTKDGRAYTALSLVPEEIGFRLRALTVFGGVIGWLFAAPPEADLDAPAESANDYAVVKNGFTLTGGVLNHTTLIEFDDGSVATIKQRFEGVDEYDQLRVRSQVAGQTPDHLRESGFDDRFEMDDYRETYSRLGGKGGRLFASTKRSYRVGDKVHQMVVNQTIVFDECVHGGLVVETKANRLAVSRHFILFDDREKVVRYAMSNIIVPAKQPASESDDDEGEEEEEKEEEDPCMATNPCSDFAECHVRGDSFRCVCIDGYEGDGFYCREKNDDCATLACDPLTARCAFDDQLGRAICECLPGFELSGERCVKIRRKEGGGDVVLCAQCDAYARCVGVVEGRAVCECNLGYVGNGYECRVTTCSDLECDENVAICVEHENTKIPQCRCKPGFVGDGQNCRRPRSDTADDCDSCDDHAVCEYDERVRKRACRCKRGYEGNGFECSEGLPCNIANDCDLNAECLLDERANRYKCLCKNGFNGDGYYCSTTSCRTTENICHENAQCYFNDEYESYMCRCNDGYRGSGEMCISNEDHIRRPAEVEGETAPVLEKRKDGCSMICHSRATCFFDPAANENSCRCNPGFAGDGVDSCSKIIEIAPSSCDQDRSLCHENAQCIPFRSVYICQCSQGFSGDGRICEETNPPAPAYPGVSETPGFLVYAHGMSLMKISTNPELSDVGKQILLKPGMTSIGIDTDCREGFIYWSDMSSKAIMRSNYHGEQVETVISSDLGSPEGIAVDWLARNLYWTDSQYDRIVAAKLDGSFRKIIVDTDLVNPRAIVVDPGNGRLFWADWNRNAPKIEVADLDGSNRRVFMKEGLGLPNGLTILRELNQLCVADAKFTKIDCVDLDDPSAEKKRRTIHAAATYPFGLTNFGNALFWTDWKSNRIEGVALNGDKLDKIDLPAGGNGRIYGIVSMDDRCPRDNNECAHDNGGCQPNAFCFANPEFSSVCACPDDNDSCQVDEATPAPKYFYIF